MSKKKILPAILFFSLSCLLFTAPDEGMKVLLKLDINEKAQGVVQENVWKSIPFNLQNDSKVRVTITATANDNGRRDDDDLKVALDNEDFGWATEKAWDGRDLRGTDKDVVIERSLLAGAHKLTFWADQNPTLRKIVIEVENRDPAKGPTIREVSYIDKIGVKLVWETIPNANGYQIFRKGKKDREFVSLIKLSENSYIDTTVLFNENYRYKIAVLGSGNKPVAYSDEGDITVRETVPPAVPSDFKVIESSANKVILSWKKNTEDDFVKYIVYKKADGDSEYKVYREIKNISENSLVDLEAAEGSNLSYRISAVDNSDNESERSNELFVMIKSGGVTPVEVVEVFPRDFYPGSTVTIYFSDKKSKQMRRARQNMQRRDSSIKITPKQVYVRYGFNGWDKNYLLPEAEDPAMTYDDSLGYWKFDLKIPYFAKSLDLAFKDEYDNYDRNWSKDYAFVVSKDIKAPSTPSNLKVSEGSRVVYLEWVPSPEADVALYEVRRSKDPNLGFMDPASLISKELKVSYFRDTTVNPGETYYYKVSAFDYSGNGSPMSEAIKAVVKVGGIVLNDVAGWDPVSPVEGEKLRIYFTPSKSKLKVSKQYLVKVGVNGWDTTVKPISSFELLYDRVMDAWYYDYVAEIGVKQVNLAFGDGTGSWDDNAGKSWSVNIRPDTNPPAKVGNFKAKPLAKQIRLFWDKNSESDIAGYNIFRGKYKINQELITDNSFEDTIGLEEGKEYEYRIVAVDKSGNIGPENVMMAGTLKDLISVPEIVYTADSRTQTLRLMASIAKVVNWQLEIYETSSNQLIRTYSGRGDVAIVIWNLKDSKDVRVKPGNYRYKVSIMDDETVLPREVDIQIFN